MEEKMYWYWLCNLQGIGLKKIESLITVFKSAEGVFRGIKKEFEVIGKLTEADIKELTDENKKYYVEKQYNKLKINNIRFITREDREYPEKLLNIYMPPWAIYVKGRLPENNSISIAVVGARSCSYYGREIAFNFGSELSKNNINIISGLARGIDTYAHKGSLAAGGNTFGIMGCGINICYPYENIEIYNDIVEQGGIISEYGPDVKPFPGNFPMRNRIISGLSDGVLVVEAREKSGSLITADLGLEQGKEIYTIPGRITDRLSDGCNKLIKQGAKCVQNPYEIVEDFRIYGKGFCTQNIKNKYLLETKEKIVYANLSLDEKHIEQISQENNMSISEVMEVVLSLEIKGFIRQTTKNYYIVTSEI